MRKVRGRFGRIGGVLRVTLLAQAGVAGMASTASPGTAHAQTEVSPDELDAPPADTGASAATGEKRPRENGTSTTAPAPAVHSSTATTETDAAGAGAASTPASISAAARGPRAPGTLARCAIGDHGDISPHDARTAAGLVCEALLEAGVDVDVQPVPIDAVVDDEVYRIELRPLGDVVILRASHEPAPGNAAATRSVRLAGIEEVTVAAPRIAKALIDGSPLTESATVDSMVDEETRRYRKRHGETMVGLGVFGYALPDKVAGYGAYIKLQHQTARFAIGGEARIGGSPQEQGDGHLYGLAVSGRYFFTDGDVGPFIGAGLGIIWLGAAEDTRTSDGTPDTVRMEGSGLAPFAEVGVELMRLNRSRLEIVLRADTPIFELEGDDAMGVEHDFYALPISLMAAFSFH